MFLQFAEELFGIRIEFGTTAEHHGADRSVQGAVNMFLKTLFQCGEVRYFSATR
jgi:hypothetical protein